jgi:hypothetical protein
LTTTPSSSTLTAVKSVAMAVFFFCSKPPTLSKANHRLSP